MLKKQLDSEIRNKLNRGDVSGSICFLQHTPQKLLDCGLSNKPIYFSLKHLQNGLHPKGRNPHWHGLEVSDYVNMIDVFENPAFIIDSFSDDCSVICVGDKVDRDGLPLMGSIKTNGLSKYEYSNIKTNYLTSVYGKDNFLNFLDRSCEADFVLYADKEKVAKLSDRCVDSIVGSKIDYVDLVNGNLFGDDLSKWNKVLHKSENIVDDYSLTEKLDDFVLSDKQDSVGLEME